MAMHTAREPRLVGAGRETAALVILVVGAFLSLLPWVSSSLSLVVGVVFGLVFGNPHVALTRRLSRRLLSLSVVGLGASMDLRAVASAGISGAGAAALSITLCVVIGLGLARLLRVAPKAGLLVSIGTAICGGSAIAAVAPAVRARDHEVAVALATVFLLNAVALVVFPIVGHAAGLDERTFGLWAALAIHDTSSVVGAAMSYGQTALEVATTVKLARALWIVPMTFVMGALSARLEGGDDATPARGAARPWFIAGFLVAAALATYVPALRPAGVVISALARRTMSMTLFLVGSGLTRASLKQAGVRPLLHGTLLWLIVASASLGALLWRAKHGG